ncbi:Rrf2 family transcriptional regulator [Tenuifilaceae bacterium CYCD]|nr:Rrf2 family transcriptional regulator [Tenuifilaceae bacterium CYCD]
MLSNKTRYAILALTKLSAEYGKGAIQIGDIAEAERIPKRFLENILLELKNMGLLGSKLGKNGGYFLLKDPSSINLAEIVRHFEGTIAMLYCVSEKAYQPCDLCKNEDSCRIKSTFKIIRDNTFEILSNTTFRDLVEDK